ncbi:MAG: extracellular solute-binding protein [Anaerolineae bacterium]|nr:extracellular solute-binding protein [Anaerolineae bacterium]
MSKSKFSRRSFLKSAAIGTAGLALGNMLRMPMSVRAQSGTINYWHHFTSDAEFAGMEEVIKLFNAKYPDIQIVQENIPNADFMAKFTAAVQADSRPNTAMVTADRVLDMVAMGGLIDLTDRVKNWDLKKYFPDSRFDGVTVDGKIYGVPSFTFVDWCYYRKDYFEEAGIAAPPTTYQEFQDAAIKLTDASKNRYGFGMRGGDGGQGFIIDAIQAFGSELVVDGKAAIDKAKAMDAIKFWSELFTVHKVVPPSAPNDSFRQIMDAFKTGQTAMVWHHTGSLAEITAALGDKFGTYVRPKGPKAQIARVSFQYNGMMKDENADAAWDWLAFWGESDAAITFLEKTGYFPVSEAVATDPRITSNSAYDAAVATQKFGILPPRFIGYAGWAQKVVLPEFQKVLIGGQSVEQCVDTIIKELEKALA